MGLESDLDRDFLPGESFLFCTGDLDLNLRPSEPDLRKGDLFGENLPLDLDRDLLKGERERPLGGDLYLGLKDLPLNGDFPLDHDLDLDLENWRLLGDLENDLNLDLDLDLLGDHERLGVKDLLGDRSYPGD